MTHSLTAVPPGVLELSPGGRAGSATVHAKRGTGISEVARQEADGRSDTESIRAAAGLVTLESDAVLWERSRTTDPEAFGEIFDRHADAVHGYRARRLRSADAADDLVSIVFLEAWRRRDDVVLEQESALPWLFGVARRTLMRRTRDAMRHRAALRRMPAALIEPDHADDVVAEIDNSRRLAAVAAAFTRLRRSDQDIIALCVWQALDYSAAAVALGVPVGTVRSRLSRARARLSALVGDFEGDTTTEQGR